MNHPNICHVVVSLAAGGLERLVVDWTNARNAQRPGSTVVVCLDEPGDLADQVEGRAVFSLNADRKRSPWDMAAVRRLRREVSSQKSVVRSPETESELSGFRSQLSAFPARHSFSDGGSLQPFSVVHSHNLAAQQYAVLATLGTGVRHVHTQHGANWHVQGLGDRIRSRILTRLTDEVVAVSQATAETMIRHQGLSRKRIRVILNGVAPPPSYSAAEIQALRQQWRIPSGAFVIGSVGRLAYVKGYDRLLKAFAAYCRTPTLPHSHTPILLLVGDGPERKALEDQARSLGIADEVVFAGFHPEARRFYGLMDLFVLPSRSEGLSVALLEAMAAGCPAAVTDAGSSLDVIGNGEAGFVLPADESAWNEFLLGLVANRQRLVELGQRGKERVVARYSLESTLQAYEELYAGLSL